jgi:hypothetical protein
MSKWHDKMSRWKKADFELETTSTIERLRLVKKRGWLKSPIKNLIAPASKVVSGFIGGDS